MCKKQNLALEVIQKDIRAANVHVCKREKKTSEEKKVGQPLNSRFATKKKKSKGGGRKGKSKKCLWSAGKEKREKGRLERSFNLASVFAKVRRRACENTREYPCASSILLAIHKDTLRREKSSRGCACIILSTFNSFSLAHQNLGDELAPSLQFIHTFYVL